MTTLNLQVGASSDDAFQATDDTVNITFIALTVDASTEHVGLRFTNVTIPSGAMISDARLTVKIVDSTSDEPKHRLRGQLAANPGTFTTTSNNIDSRARTTAQVDWNVADLGATTDSLWEWGSPNGSPTSGANLSSIIQEIINQGGWASGNAVVLIYEQIAPDDAARDLAIRTYDNAPGDAASLSITYTLPEYRKSTIIRQAIQRSVTR